MAKTVPARFFRIFRVVVAVDAVELTAVVARSGRFDGARKGGFAVMGPERFAGR